MSSQFIEGPVECPICYSEGEWTEAKIFRGGVDSKPFECSRCGRFKLSEEILEDQDMRLDLTSQKRALISHLLSKRSAKEIVFVITNEYLQQIRETRRTLPKINKQLDDLILKIGQFENESGDSFTPNDKTVAEVGALSWNSFCRLFSLGSSEGLIDLVEASQDVIRNKYRLSIAGWSRYSSVEAGKTASGYGFLAMKFGDPILDDLAKNVLKPTISDGLGQQLVDLRDVPQAGIIDNLMRQQISESDFVIVDLTHDNSGAYWEAGYAEGLGKPVIYICEETKFNEKSTHFDTNYCTTVIWKQDTLEQFAVKLVATLKRSLGHM